MKTYQAIAMKIGAIDNCIKAENWEWRDRHEEKLDDIMYNAPIGSGINAGTSILLDQCDNNKLVFAFGYHHMNDNGMYDGWTEHKVIVTPSLQFGINIKITGRNRNMIKDYLHDVYSTWLEEDNS